MDPAGSAISATQSAQGDGMRVLPVLALVVGFAGGNVGDQLWKLVRIAGALGLA
jgi:hypothetical protein